MKRGLSVIVGVGLLAGCALKGDVRRVELQVAALQEDVEGLEAARKAQLDSVLLVLAVLQQNLAAQQAYLVRLRGDMRTDLLSIEQQIVTVQELTGQSQQRLTELRAKLEAQAQQPAPAESPPVVPGGTGVPAAPATPPPGPGPDQMFDLSLQQLRRGSFGTARLGFREFLRLYPNDERAPDALYHVGESFEPENGDSAVAVFQAVVSTYPNATPTPSALYKLGLLAEARGDKAGARTYWQRVVSGFPRSDEANLARDKLQHLGH